MSKNEGKDHDKESHDDKKDAPSEKKEGAEGEEGSLEASFAESKKKAKKKKLIIAGAALAVLVIGGGAGAFFSGAFGGKSATGEHGEAPAADGHAAEAPKEGDAHGGEAPKEGEHGALAKPAFFQLGDILVNLSGDSKRPNFLKISITLELANEKDATEMTIIKPRVVDNFQVYLRELRVEDLRGSAGMYRLREELLLRINEIVAPIRVRDVLFQELLVQ